MVSCCSYLSGYIKLVNWRVFVGKRILMRVLWFLKKKKKMFSVCSFEQWSHDIFQTIDSAWEGKEGG